MSESELRIAAENALLDQVDAANEECQRLLRGWRGWLPWRLWRVQVLARRADRLLAQIEDDYEGYHYEGEHDDCEIDSPHDHPGE